MSELVSELRLKNGMVVCNYLCTRKSEGETKTGTGGLRREGGVRSDVGWMCGLLCLDERASNHQKIGLICRLCFRREMAGRMMGWRLTNTTITNEESYCAIRPEPRKGDNVRCEEIGLSSKLKVDSP